MPSTKLNCTKNSNTQALQMTGNTSRRRSKELFRPTSVRIRNFADYVLVQVCVSVQAITFELGMMFILVTAKGIKFSGGKTFSAMHARYEPKQTTVV